MTGDEGGPLIHRCGDPLAVAIARTDRQRLPCQTVDMHCHILVPEVQGIVAGCAGQQAEAEASLRTFGAEALAINGQQFETVGPKLTRLDERLADMDAIGIDIQVITVSPTQYFYTVKEPEIADLLAATVNDHIAETCAAHPERLRGLATVSLQYPESAARQLDHAMGKLGLRGVEISSHVDGINISDRRFEPFWAQADALGAIVFIHPWGTTVGDRLSRHYLGNTVGQPMETTIALSNLIFEGTLDRYPGVKIVAAHGGGYLPSYITRSDHAFGHRPDACACAHPPSSYLKRIWVDSLVYEPAQLRRLVEVMGPSQIVLGTDYPFDMGHYDPAGLLQELDHDTVVAIAGGNALALLG